MGSVNICDIHEPIKGFEVPSRVRSLLDSARTKQEKIEALVYFASHHGLFSDRPELLRKTLGREA